MPRGGYARYEDDPRLGNCLSNVPMVLLPTLETTEEVSRSTTEQLLKDRMVQSYLLKPRSWQARLFCVCFWLATAAGICVGCYFLVPLLLKKVVVPLQEVIKVGGEEGLGSSALCCRQGGWTVQGDHVDEAGTSTLCLAQLCLQPLIGHQVPAVHHCFCDRTVPPQPN